MRQRTWRRSTAPTSFVLAASVLVAALTALPSGPGVLPKTLVLSNWMRVRYRSFPGHPIVYINIAVGAGVADEPPDKLGLSYVLARVLDRRRPPGDEGTLATHPSNVGGKVSVKCTTPRTHILIRVPSEHVASAVGWAAEGIFAPLEGREQGDLDAVQEQIMSYGQSRSPAMARLLGWLGFDLSMDRAVRERVFAGTPYASGWCANPHTTRTATTGDLRTWHESRYTGGNTLISITGGFDEAELTQVVETHWSRLPRGSRAERPEPCTALRGPVRVVLRDMTMRDTRVIWCGFAWPGQDYENSAAHSVLRQVIRERLHEELLRRPHLAYRIGVSRRRLGGAGYSFIHTKVRNQWESDMLALLNCTLLELAEKGVTPSEFEGARRVIASAAERWSQNPRVLGWTYARIWSEAVLSRILSDGTRSVTLDDVNRVARRFITPRNQFVVVRRSIMTPRSAVASAIGLGLACVVAGVLTIGRLWLRLLGARRAGSVPVGGADA